MTDDNWREGVNSRLDRLEGRLQSLETAGAVDEVHRINVEHRLTSIENTLQWLVRLIIGALLLGIIGFALNGGFNV